MGEVRTEDRVLECVTAFLSTISAHQPPFPELRKYFYDDGLVCLNHPAGDGLVQDRFGHAVAELEQSIKDIYDSGAKSVVVTFSDPKPEVWAYDDKIGAVWFGYRKLVDGKEVSDGINLFSLLKISGEWKIIAVADREWPSTETMPSPTSESPFASVLDDFFVALKDQQWDDLTRTLLPGSGAVLPRPPKLMTVTIPEWIDYLKGVIGVLPPGTVIDEKLHDVQARTCGELGFAWTPFVVQVDGKVVRKGNNIMTFLRQDGKWLISGCQDWGTPVES